MSKDKRRKGKLSKDRKNEKKRKKEEVSEVLTEERKNKEEEKRNKQKLSEDMNEKRTKKEERRRKSTKTDTIDAWAESQAQLTLEQTETCFQKFMRLSGFEYWFLLLITFVYMLLGGTVFFYLEHTAENTAIQAQKDAYVKDLAKMTLEAHKAYESDCGHVTLEGGTPLPKERIAEILQKYYTYDDFYKLEPMWKYYFGGFEYTFTLLTTIGMGRVYPRTDLSRIITIVYALLGIPLFLSAVSRFGGLVFLAIHRPYCWIRRLCSPDQTEYQPVIMLFIFVLVASLALISFVEVNLSENMFLDPEYNGTKIETAFNGVYFYFQCLSTIGLGDISMKEQTSDGDTSFIPMYVSGYIITIILIALISVIYSLIQGRFSARELQCNCCAGNPEDVVERQTTLVEEIDEE